MICFECGCIGHMANDCLVVICPSATLTASAPKPDANMVIESQKPFSDWMLVKSRKSRPTKFGSTNHPRVNTNTPANQRTLPPHQPRAHHPFHISNSHALPSLFSHSRDRAQRNPINPKRDISPIEQHEPPSHNSALVPSSLSHKMKGGLSNSNKVGKRLSS